VGVQENALRASGGLDLWRLTRPFTVHMSISGDLFSTKSSNAKLKELVVEGSTHVQELEMTGFARADIRALYRRDWVALESAQGLCARQLLAMVTAGHDLRQHLQIIRAALENRESAETVLANQWIDTAKEQARRLEEEALHLVENAQSDIESMRLRVAAFSIDDTLRRIDRDWRVFAASKGLALKVRPRATMVVSDRRLLSVILDNLVANAVKYINLGQINVDCRSEGDRLLVSVEDTGPGIACDELGWFAQSPCMPQLNTNGSGMALGLDIVHRSAALLGHEIDVASVPGIGSCLTGQVPLATSTATEPQW
jgi:signal transduction histidine kinase